MFYIDDKERLINRLMKYRPSISSTEELLELRLKVDMVVVRWLLGELIICVRWWADTNYM